MTNLAVYVPAVDGSIYPLHEEGESCKEAIHCLFTDDFAAPPRSLDLIVRTDSGRKVRVVIPYDSKQRAVVFVDDEVI